MKRLIVLFLFIILAAGCVEEFDLKLKDAEPRLVVEGFVSNLPGPYYVRLTKSTPGGVTSIVDNSYYNRTDSAEPVKNATVIISDDFNQIDTLKYYIVDIDDHKYHDIVFSYNSGFYKTSRLKGIAGRTYYLKIIAEGKEYRASAYMPPVPEIDSLGYYLKKTEMEGKWDTYVPLLYFKEPQGIKNYYLIQLRDDIHLRIFNSNVLWQCSILSDEFLKPYVNGLNVSLGATPRGINSLPIYSADDSIYVALSSLTKESYNYYKALLDQFENDGGTYKPTPASPQGNISNGGLGLFRASAVSEKRTYIPRTSN